MEEATVRNARIRDEGTRNLVAAAIATGVRRMIAQSVAFAYADGPLPHRENDALAIEASGRAGVSARGVANLERQVLGGPFEGVVLRYGRLYGPGTGFDRASGAAPVHVDAAAHAAVLAVQEGAKGIYNIAEDDGAVASDKAVRELNWSATCLRDGRDDGRDLLLACERGRDGWAFPEARPQDSRNGGCDDTADRGYSLLATLPKTVISSSTDLVD